jgi:hypothetical protein
MATKTLEDYSDDDLWGSYENCLSNRGHTVEAIRREAEAKMRDIERLILDRANLSVGNSGVKLDSPLGKLMNAIIHEPNTVAKAITATQSGLPAMAGVEPVLLERLGLLYEKRYEASVQAGYLVAKMMNKHGYHQTGKKGKMPPGSIAQTAEIYAAKK